VRALRSWRGRRRLCDDFSGASQNSQGQPTEPVTSPDSSLGTCEFDTVSYPPLTTLIAFACPFELVSVPFLACTHDRTQQDDSAREPFVCLPRLSPPPQHPHTANMKIFYIGVSDGPTQALSVGFPSDANLSRCSEMNPSLPSNSPSSETSRPFPASHETGMPARLPQPGLHF
jgi:hypothetical protein